jgi:hypothetical protein
VQVLELHIDGVVTQVRSLARAEQQVRDCLEALLDIDASVAIIDLVPDLRVRTAMWLVE